VLPIAEAVAGKGAWGRDAVQTTGLVAGRISSIKSSSTGCRSAEDRRQGDTGKYFQFIKSGRLDITWYS